jgi:Mg-chelatase subunit ChlD
MKTTTIFLYSLIILVLFFAACESQEPCVFDATGEIEKPKCPGVNRNDAVVLRIDYERPFSQAPFAQVLLDQSDGKVDLDPAQGVNIRQVNRGRGAAIEIELKGIRIRDEENNYLSQCHVIEEFSEDRTSGGCWFEQTEFENDTSLVRTRLAIAFCLDVSSSLGDDRENVKENALSFAASTLINTDSLSYISLTLFADTVITYPFTNRLSDLQGYIDNFPYPDLNAQTSTRLSDGILAGLSMLDQTQLPVDEKVLVAFTDGNDNGSFQSSLKSDMIRNSDHERYMIGYEGKAEEYSPGYLQSLASSSSGFMEADSERKLKRRFNDISELVASIYTIRYYRSAQDTDGAQPIRVVFYTKEYVVR